MSEWAIEAEKLVKKFPRKENKDDENGAKSSHKGWRLFEKRKKEVAYFTAVNGVDLQIAQGEIFGLLGPNGAGNQQPFVCCVLC